MTVFRLWSAVNQLSTKPQPSATSDWWNLCDDCNHLNGPHDTEDAAAAAAHRCRLRKPERKPPADRNQGRTWTEAEDDLVRTLPPSQAARAVGVSPTTITRRRAHLGVAQARGKNFEWTPEQDAILAARSIDDAMRLTGASKSAVEWRRKQLRKSGAIEPRAPRVPWTADEDAIVAAHSISEAARLLPGRSAENIRHRRWKLTRQGVELAFVGTPGPKTKAA
ncbi:hypothetical protein H5399_05150 [Tessaracoccus sp. MC1627]|uniref:hypothetical protein n=1 Tax=Tessaracoccus sp. MC1627 TaxID=2760312 RepID=UPI0015FFC74C|nr:hypothetical protein [Tessaracoccus sp. MC1627]MBB1511991.1 hypothetical protein [Tessaracoccus sp. MC1627]